MKTLPLHPTPTEIEAYYRRTSRDGSTSIGTMGNATVAEVVSYITVLDTNQAYVRTLPPDDLKVLHDYLLSSYGAINDALCKGSFRYARGRALPNTVTLLRLFAEAPPLPVDVVVWRGVGASGGRKEDTSIYKHQVLDPVRGACGFVSTSLSQRVAVNFTSPVNKCCLMRIAVPKGTPVLAISAAHIVDSPTETEPGAYMSQCEILLPPGGTFRPDREMPAGAVTYTEPYKRAESYMVTDMLYIPPDLAVYTAQVAALPDIQEFYLRMPLEEYDYWSYVEPAYREIVLRVMGVGKQLAIPIEHANEPATLRALRDAVDASVLRGLDALEAEGYIQYFRLGGDAYVVPSIQFEASPLVVRKLVDHLVTPLLCAYNE